MARTLTGPVATALTAQAVRLAYLIELSFDSGPFRAWTGAQDFNWAASGRVFLGLGNVLEVSGIEESQRVEANGIEITLSGVSPTMVAYALAENYRNRRVRVWVAFFDIDTEALIADPVPVFAGRMDVMHIADAGDSAQIRLTCESRLVDLRRARERRYTDEDQKEMYPADRGLEYVAGLQDREVAWGKAEPR